MDTNRGNTPLGIRCLVAFAIAAAGISAASAVSLIWPGGPLEPMWRINPRAREEFSALGIWSPILLGVLSLVCLVAAIGSWRRTRAGYWLIVVGLAVNLAGDALNALVRRHIATALGMPIVAAILAYLMTRNVREYFGIDDTADHSPHRRSRPARTDNFY
jgi:hypothetical protein